MVVCRLSSLEATLTNNTDYGSEMPAAVVLEKGSMNNVHTTITLSVIDRTATGHGWRDGAPITASMAYDLLAETLQSWRTMGFKVVVTNDELWRRHLEDVSSRRAA